MPILATQTEVKILFKTKGLDTKPFENTQKAKVVQHRKTGGWLLLEFKSGTKHQYRVRYNKEKGMFHNDIDSAVRVEVSLDTEPKF
jgi:hypothetical protein